MADPIKSKCDPSLNLTCDELFKNNCITAEENQFCEDEWHAEIEPATADEFVYPILTPSIPDETIRQQNKLSVFSDLFQTSSVEDDVCYEDFFEEDFCEDDIYFDNAAEGVCVEFDFELYQSLLPKSPMDMDEILKKIKLLDDNEYMRIMSDK